MVSRRMEKKLKKANKKVSKAAMSLCLIYPLFLHANTPQEWLRALVIDIMPLVDKYRAEKKPK